VKFKTSIDFLKSDFLLSSVRSRSYLLFVRLNGMFY